MQKELEAASKLIDTLVEFSVTYGFQILGALVFLFIGLKLAGWSGRKVSTLIAKRNVDAALSRLLGNLVKLVVVAFVAIITLGNFGISIAPLIALAGAAAFGATMALQGPLSNYGAGFAILFGRPFTAGDTITVKKVSGVVEDVTLPATILIGEDGERIVVPNKEIVGEVIVNSRQRRIVETRLAIGGAAEAARAVELLGEVLAGAPEVGKEPQPQIGIHDFTYGGAVVGLRFWVDTKHYYQHRYAVNMALMKALGDAGIDLLGATGRAIPAQPLSADA